MVRSPLFVGITSLACTLFAFSAGAEPPLQLQYATLDISGAIATRPDKINNAGVIEGTYFDGAGNAHGFLKAGADPTTLDHPLAVHGTVLTGINSRGRVVGFYLDENFNEHGFSTSAGGDWRDLPDPPSDPPAIPFDINNSDAIVGVDGFSRGFLLVDGAFQFIDDPGARFTSALGISESGAVVGMKFPFEPFRRPTSFLLINGQFSELSEPGFQALGINNRGNIVGRNLFNRTSHLYGPDGPLPIAVPGARGTAAAGISDRNWVVGSWFDAANREHGFIAKP